MLRACLLLALACLAAADLPIDCRYSDAVGTWLVTETARTGDASLDCSSMGETVYTKSFTLAYPDLVTDELGNTGTWTMIYNQGFEVNINQRSYWAPFDYTWEPQAYNCERLFSGWARDDTVRNWACFTAVKEGAAESPMRHVATPSSANLNKKYVNDKLFIDRINAAQNSWSAKAYPEHEQYTVKEMLQRAGGSYVPLPPTVPATEEQKQRIAALPTNFDWRDVAGVNYVTPVRDQGGCGSCYAFASAAMLEARLQITTNGERQDIFSTQNIVSCTKLAEGCLGGFAYLIAGRYSKDQGHVSEDCYTYLGVDAPCDTDMSCGRTYVDDYNYIGGYYGGSNEEVMLEELVNNGPYAVGFEVLADFYLYESGIYHHVPAIKSDFDPLYVVNHAVLVVGYGVEDTTGEKFWIVKNSWGDTFGEAGYFRIRRGTNEVGIESIPFSAHPIP